MSLSLVVAVADNGVIGRDGDLPWRLPGELKYFRRLTMGHTVLMGRRTFDSLPKALDGREMWVLSRDPSFAPSSARRFDTLDAALAAAGSRDLMVIGGASLYAATLPLADTIWLTRVHANPDGDTHLPQVLASGVRVLIYAGDVDFICNWLGNKAPGFWASVRFDWISRAESLCA